MLGEIYMKVSLRYLLLDFLLLPAVIQGNRKVVIQGNRMVVKKVIQRSDQKILINPAKTLPLEMQEKS